MSLYDIAVADGHQVERGQALLPLLGADLRVDRYRDCWVEKGDDGPVIAVYTRIGGGNRADYAACIAGLRASPLYIRDADDSFDSTYATFWFRVPDGHREELAMDAVDPVDMSERWKQAIDEVQSGKMRPGVAALGDQLAAFLNDPAPGSRVMKI